MAPIAVELPPLSLFSGAFVTDLERLEKQPSYASHNSNIRQVEDVPMECADMKREKICDSAILDPVDRISQRTSDDEPYGDRGKPVVNMSEPIGQPQHSD